MLHTELPFVARVGIYLENFKQTNQYVWNFSCPLCGDYSEKRKRKMKRGYIYRPGTANHLNFKCHHCGKSMGFGTYLKRYQPEIYKEYVFERYQSTNTKGVSHKKIEEIYKPTKIAIDKSVELLDANLDLLDKVMDLPDGHKAKYWLLARKVPEKFLDLFYYTDEFKAYTNSLLPKKFEPVRDEHPRVIIPYLDIHGRMFAFIARSLNGEEPKYFTIKLDERDRIFGLDRVDPRRTIYVVEGAIDSMFLDNAVAVSGSSFDCETIRALKSRAVLVFDNEPRSKDICKLIRKHINLGYRVALLPEKIKTKDINEHILSGMSSKEVQELIDQHTYQGLKALVVFSEWRKCEIPNKYRTKKQ